VIVELPDWMRVDAAIAAIRGDLKTSEGGAAVMLLEALSSGAVRARQKGVAGIVPRSRWREVDLNGWSVQTLIRINAEDLHCWIVERLPPASPPLNTRESDPEDIATMVDELAQAGSDRAPPTLTAAIERRLAEGADPPLTVSWPQFCDTIRDDADGWIDKHKGKIKRRFSDKTINRATRRLRTAGGEQPSDISDNSLS
jgi:hypothetical protein